ncbi:Peroxisomal biogenesis factor 11 [Cinnamomum micranthum f. kanehirae]|uniref:Peroxisomal biogenesis factor 11 n=1 Tax=Cinnamomum micranthum f. kanehirae TaxID=337451 RepID=A0A3S3R7M9_9MAGN|nr:Peroxisomal biogenesis factor 11 [Cinnamomum micranthum f. kanehirae]
MEESNPKPKQNVEHIDFNSKAVSTPLLKRAKDRDFLTHLESYLAKRDGVDKLLKISRYAAKIALSYSLLPQTSPLHPRLKSFESSVGLSRKAFRLGKFVQDLNALNALRAHHPISLLSLLAYGGEGLYYFVEQLVWLSKTGLIDHRHLPSLQKISAWAELVGYVGSISLKIGDLKKIVEEEASLDARVEELRSEGVGVGKEMEKLRQLAEKRVMKRLSIVQDVADGLMAAADVRDGKGALTGPLLMASAGLLSALISTHKNWVSC